MYENASDEIKIVRNENTISNCLEFIGVTFNKVQGDVRFSS